MKKVLFIQPHSDDIVLSCFSRLTAPDIEPTILTIEHDQKRHEEDLKLVDLIPNLRLIQGIEFEDKSYSAYWGDNMHRKFNPDEILETFEVGQKNKTLNKIANLISDTLNDDWDEIWTCMGIGHPLHWYVHEFTKGYATGFYRDWPHSYKKRNLDFFNSYSKEFKFIGEIDDAETMEMKLEVFKGFYKSQSGLLYFEQKNVLNNFSEKYYKL